MNASVLKRVCAFIIAGALAANTNWALAGAQEPAGDKTDYGSIFENSYVLHSGRGFYYHRGEKKYFDDDNQAYMTYFKNNRILIPLTVLAQWTGMKYTWSKEREAIEMSLNENKVRVRLNEDAITVNGVSRRLDTPAVFKGNKTFVPFLEVMQGLGFHVFHDESYLTVASLTQKLPLDREENASIKDRLNDLFHVYLLNDSFEASTNAGANMLPGTLSPAGWRFNNWANPQAPNVDAGITALEHAGGSSSVYIDAVGRSNAGFESGRIPFDRNVIAYEIEYKVKTSEDYLNNTPLAYLLFYKDSAFVTSIIRGTAAANSDGWTTNKMLFHNGMYPAGDVDSFSVVVVSRKEGAAELPFAGRVFYDDVKVRKYAPETLSVKANMQSNVVGNWYKIGEEASFTCTEPGKLLGLLSLKGVIYNSHNEKVFESTVSIGELAASGWRWKAKEPGFYEIEFSGIQPDGTALPITSYYADTGLFHTPRYQGIFERERISLVFTANGTKPIGQRNEKMFFSDKGNSDLALQLADYVGFSGIRIHHIPWGPYGNDPNCISPERGVFHWEVLDERMDLIEKYKYQIIGNVLYTPQWASSRPDLTGLNTYGMYRYSIFAPANMADWEDFIGRLVERYGDRISMWEIWNEPHIAGSSTFWSDTPENYVALLKTAYTKIKEIQSRSIVTIGGIGARRYTPFYREIMKTDVSDYFDVLAMHGMELDPWTYNAIAEKAGYESKPYMNTEGHYILLNSSSSAKLDPTETELSFRAMKEFFRDFKYGALLSTFFLVAGTYNKEALPFYKQADLIRDCSALFRIKPYVEPRHAASVLHTLFDNMGKDFSYVAEYKLENGQEAVLFNKDGSPFLALWRENGNQFTLDPSIAQCLTQESTMINWEGKTVDPREKHLPGATMYFISNLDAEELGKLEKSDDEVIFTDYEKAKSNIQVPSAKADKAPLFDLRTGAPAETIAWIESDMEWVKSLEDQPEDYSGKYAVSMGTDGLYIMVDVQDETFVGFDGDTVANSWKYDSVQFAMDTIGDTAAADRLEFQVGADKNGPVLYKATAPYIGGNLPEGWSKSGSVIKGNYVRIENTSGHTIYKIFVPMSELYPYRYIGEKDEIRFSLLINNNNGGGRMGYLQWSAGIGAAKDPAFYGKIMIEER